ncbi:MAG TPA: hypothetical protein VF322_14295 [Gammaproteobacteria bacterium]
MRARRVEPEWLDELPALDPRAVRARADLRRVNRLMGASGILRHALDTCIADAGADVAATADGRVGAAFQPRSSGGRTKSRAWKGAPTRKTTGLRLVELGTGDGTLALALARRRASRWPGAAITLLDRRPAVAAGTLATMRALGWRVEVVVADAIEWLERTEPEDADRPVMFANLFVHHFAGEGLARLLAGAAGRAQAFVCVEPRRSGVALAGSRLLGLIGANDVTRHDGVASVRAGFRDGELGAAWSEAAGADWAVTERPAGLFSHLFMARRAHG